MNLVALQHITDISRHRLLVLQISKPVNSKTKTTTTKKDLA